MEDTRRAPTRSAGRASGFMAALALCCSALLVAAEPAPAGDNWPQFLGPGGVSIGNSPDLPVEWSKETNVEWVAEVPGMGWSSPIVWGSRVFVTTASSDQQMKQPSLGVDFSNEYVAELSEEGKSNEEVERLITERDNELPSEIQLTYRLICHDLESGKVLWNRVLHSGAPPVGRHRKNSYASETPVTDGERIYVLIGHLGLFALNLDGEELWHTELDARQVSLDFGSGSSPALDGDRVYVLNDNEEESFLAAFDVTTGKRLWQTLRPGPEDAMRLSGWSSPYVWRNELRTEIVTTGPGTLISYGRDGNELWRMSRMALMPIQTPFAVDGVLYASAGARRGPLVAIRPGASGDITPAEPETSNDFVIWFSEEAGGTYLPTPLLYEGGLYTLTEKGIFSRYDPATGERVYRSRIDREARAFTASPWAYDGKIFALSEEGATFVIRAGEEFELLGVNPLDEFALASPAIVGDRLLIRTQSRLYSIRRARGQ